MAFRKSNGVKFGGAAGAVALLALGGVVACGSDFSGDDCGATRTCPAAGGSPEGGQPDESGSSVDDAGRGGADSSSNAAGAPMAEEGGTDGEMAGNGGAPVADNLPPTVISVSPESEMTGVDPAAQVLITFSEPLAEATVTAESVRLLDGDNAVPGKLSYAESKVTFVPDAPLDLLTTYEIAVSDTVTDLEGAGLAEAQSFTFRVRDGAWHTVDAVTGSLVEIADAIPMTAKGNALVSWISIDTPGHYCPTTAAWFNRGKAIAPATTLTDPELTDCRSLAAGGNADGVGVLAWQEDVEYAQQFRGGKWLQGKNTVSEYGYTSLFSVGVAPSGAAVFFQHGNGETFVHDTDADGIWARNEVAISSERTLAAARIAFDSQGNGLAVWLASDANDRSKILASRYTTSNRYWDKATALPGSISSGANDGRGVPAVAFDAVGNALALWVAAQDTGCIVMMNRYSHFGSWEGASAVSDVMFDCQSWDPPALVFDGQTFVAAWTAQQEDGTIVVYSARFDMATSTFLPYEERTRSENLQWRTPRLGADSHQNLLLVWAKVAGTTGATLAYQRYDAERGAWMTAKNVSGGAVNDQDIAIQSRLPLSVSANGLGTMMWADTNAQQQLSKVRLASFY